MWSYYDVIDWYDLQYDASFSANGADGVRSMVDNLARPTKGKSVVPQAARAHRKRFHVCATGI